MIYQNNYLFNFVIFQQILHQIEIFILMIQNNIIRIFIIIDNILINEFHHIFEIDNLNHILFNLFTQIISYKYDEFKSLFLQSSR